MAAGLPLEAFDLLGHSGLRHMQEFCGTTETGLVRHRDERAKRRKSMHASYQ